MPASRIVASRVLLLLLQALLIVPAECGVVIQWCRVLLLLLLLLLLLRCCAVALLLLQLQLSVLTALVVAIAVATTQQHISAWI